MRIGKMLMVLPAVILPYSMVKRRWKMDNPTSIVYISRSVAKIRGQIKADQACIKARIPRALMADLDKGTTI